ncbi:MAG: ATP-binding cassette domain-containing protein [Shimia sp.]
MRDLVPEDGSSATPIPLHEGSGAIVVREGRMQIFLAEPRPDGGYGERRFLHELGPGDIAFCGVEEDPFALGGPDLHLIAVGGHATRAVPYAGPDWTDALLADLGRGPVLAGIDHWIGALGRHAAALITRPERLRTRLVVGAPSEGPADAPLAPGAIAAERGTVWIDSADGSVLWLDTQPLLSPAPAPLTPEAHAFDTRGQRLSGRGTADILDAGEIPAALDAFHARLSAVLSETLRIAAADAVNRTREMRARERSQSAAAFDAIEMAVAPGGRATERLTRDLASDTPRLAGAEVLCRMLRVPVPTEAAAAFEGRPTLREVQDLTRLRLRKVTLAPGWWRGDSGPLFVDDPDGGTATVLVREERLRAGYVALDPVTGGTRRIDARLAKEIPGTAYMPYPPLEDAPLAAASFVRRILTHRLSDLVVVCALTLVGALLGLGVPIATGFVVGDVIPSGDWGMLLQLAVVLGAAGLATLLCRYGTQVAVLRMEGWVGSQLQAAIIDRLLRLPTETMAAYGSADLVARASVVRSIEELFTNAVVAGLVNGVFALVSLGLMVGYAPLLALVGCGFFLLVVGLNVWIGLRQRRHDGDRLRRAADVTGATFQTVAGIEKVRLAGRETARLHAWARAYARKIETDQALARLDGLSGIVLSISGLSGTVLIFAVIHGFGLGTGEDAIGVGALAAFLTAFGNAQGGLVSVGEVLVQLMAVKPMIDHAKPVLETAPESSQAGRPAPALTGHVAFEGVSYTYPGGERPVLNDFSMTILPGQSVGVVGGSGSGKSTFVRLLLGFDRPRTGYVRVNGQDVSQLNVMSLRRQIGVVVQDVRLASGTLLDTLTSGDPTIGEAEIMQVARSVALDADIANLPMGLHTLVTDKAAFSGGQLQRIALARALLAKPRLLVLDEATSALDNIAQATVADTLSRMGITCISIAHRLSTIRHCDVIFVLEKGRVAESGNYDALMERNGLFAELARRQLA